MTLCLLPPADLTAAQPEVLTDLGAESPSPCGGGGMNAT